MYTRLPVHAISLVQSSTGSRMFTLHYLHYYRFCISFTQPAVMKLHKRFNMAEQNVDFPCYLQGIFQRCSILPVLQEMNLSNYSVWVLDRYLKMTQSIYFNRLTTRHDMLPKLGSNTKIFLLVDENKVRTAIYRPFHQLVCDFLQGSIFVDLEIYLF